MNTSPVISAPLQTIDAFALAVGVTAKTARCWVDKGLVPTIYVGSRRLVNVFALCQAGTSSLLGEAGLNARQGGRGRLTPPAPLTNRGGVNYKTTAQNGTRHV